MISACSSSERPALPSPAGFFVTIYSKMSYVVPPLNRLSPFHQRVLFSSPSSLSPSSSSTPSFFCISGVQMYSRCTTHVSRMTKLAAILTPHSAEWIGKYRAVEEWSIHPSAFTPVVAVSVFAERRLFLHRKCTLHSQKECSSTLDE